MGENLRIADVAPDKKKKGRKDSGGGNESDADRKARRRREERKFWERMGHVIPDMNYRDRRRSKGPASSRGAEVLGENGPRDSRHELPRMEGARCLPQEILRTPPEEKQGYRFRSRRAEAERGVKTASRPVLGLQGKRRVASAADARHPCRCRGRRVKDCRATATIHGPRLRFTVVLFHSVDWRT